MEQTKKSVSLGITVNMGDYENVRLDVTIESVFTPEDDPQDYILHLQASRELAWQCERLLEARLRAQFEGHSADYLTTERIERVVRTSSLFRWISVLTPDDALTVLRHLQQRLAPPASAADDNPSTELPFPF